jgi:hypothetical protein
MKALSLNGFKIGLVSLFIVPWFVGRAGFHCRENMNQTGMCASFFDDALYQSFFSDISFG